MARWAIVLALAGCAARVPLAVPEAPAQPVIPVLIEGLGGFHRPITTSSAEAQRWFDQGLALAYGFNAQEAVRSFEKSAQLDPACAMAQWGIAYASGPDINFTSVPEPRARRALEAVRQAQRLAAGATPVERALIEAMGPRWSAQETKERGDLDRDFADSMRGVFAAFPGDADAAAIFGGALLQLHPWGQWSAEGKPSAEIPEALGALEAALSIDGKHPLANHLYIHALEASPHPERAATAAGVLRTLQPASGHLLHMPSHIDVRTGHWDSAVASNQRAIEADHRYLALVGHERGFLPYQVHDQHMLAYAAMMSGQSALALAAVRSAVEIFPARIRRSHSAGFDGYSSMLDEVRMRFGRWDEILGAEEPGEEMPYSRAIHRAARAIARVARGQVSDAELERARFIEARAKVPASWEFKGVKGSALLEAAGLLLEGEIALRAGRQDQGIEALRKAAAAEDAFGYGEPPARIQPIRHPLGAALLRAGKPAEAEAVFREDLARWPGNGWSLFGLGRALRMQHKDGEAAAVEAQFTRAWQDADLQIDSPCLCQSGE